MSKIIGKVCCALLALCLPGTAHSSSYGGVDTPNGVNELPLSVQGVPGIDIFSPTEAAPTPKQWPAGSAPYVLIPGAVGIGTQQPTAALDVAGEVRVGQSSLECSQSTEGALRYDFQAHAFLFCNGSSWSSLGGVTIKRRIYTANGVYTPCSGIRYADVEVLGGGAGGGGTGITPGTDGGDSAFGNLIVAGGGRAVDAANYSYGGAGGVAKAAPMGAFIINGASGGSAIANWAGLGGASMYGGSLVNLVAGGTYASPASGYGAGGSGAANREWSGGGGGSGAYIKALLPASSLTTPYSIVVGSAGVRGIGGFNGSPGSPGVVIVTEYCN